MRHLETKREAAGRKRATMMSQGIAQFLELTSNETENYKQALEQTSLLGSMSRRPSTSGYDDEGRNRSRARASKDNKADENTPANILDKIKLTLDHAADILRSSLELAAGGVVFLDTALGYHEASLDDDYFSGKQAEERDVEFSVSSSEFSSTQRLSSKGSSSLGYNSPGHVRSLNDEVRPARVMAMSATAWTPGSNTLNGKTLQSLITAYPKGNIWYIDDNGFFSSLEQISDEHGTGKLLNPSGRRRSVGGKVDVTRQKAEAALLSKVFHRARQIIFLPLWDLAGSKFSF